MNKEEIVQKVLKALQGRLEVSQKGQKTAHDDMIEAESAMQTRYGSAKEEAEVLAQSLAQHSGQIDEMISALRSLDVSQSTGTASTIQIGSIVYLYFVEAVKEEIYMLLPEGGGTSVETEMGTITTITPSSPLGKSLLGKRVGNSLTIGPHRKQIEITTIY